MLWGSASCPVKASICAFTFKQPFKVWDSGCGSGAAPLGPQHLHPLAAVCRAAQSHCFLWCSSLFGGLHCVSDAGALSSALLAVPQLVARFPGGRCELAMTSKYHQCCCFSQVKTLLLRSDQACLWALEFCDPQRRYCLLPH